MLPAIKGELEKLAGHPLRQRFLDRLAHNPKLTKREFVPDHICAFFVPIHRQSGSVYLGHHIKGRDWMPPGGHIEPGEHPVETVRREFREELRVGLGKEKIEIFNLSIKKIEHPRRYCRLHYDLWYLVWTDKLDFDFDPGEFYEAGWFGIREGAKKIKHNPDYRRIVAGLLGVIK